MLTSGKGYPSLLKRTVQIFGIEIVLSLIGVLLVVSGFVPMNYSAYINLILVLQLVKIIVLWRLFTRSIYKIKDVTLHRRVTLTAYAIVTAVVWVMAFFNIEPVYTYLFFLFKILRYTGCTRFLSAVFVSLYNFILVIFISGIFVQQIRHYM